MRPRCCRGCGLVDETLGTLGENQAMKKPSFGFAGGCVCCPPEIAAAAASRRNFLAGGLAALGLGATAPSRVFAQAVPPAASSPPPKTVIDVHHHIAPPAYVQELIARG